MIVNLTDDEHYLVYMALDLLKHEFEGNEWPIMLSVDLQSAAEVDALMNRLGE